MIEANNILKKKIEKIDLLYEGVETTNCTIMYSESILRCRVANNTNEPLTKVRLWIMINDNLMFDVKRLFNYYHYV
jgi:hypothetical protein